MGIVTTGMFGLWVRRSQGRAQVAGGYGGRTLTGSARARARARARSRSPSARTAGDVESVDDSTTDPSISAERYFEAVETLTETELAMVEQHRQTLVAEEALFAQSAGLLHEMAGPSADRATMDCISDLEEVCSTAHTAMTAEA